MNILVLEDEIHHQMLFEKALLNIQLNPLIASDVDEAKIIIEEKANIIDFAILDIRIGEHKYAGIDFGAELRLYYSDIPIIFVSSQFGQAEILQKIKAEFPDKTPLLLPKKNILNPEAFCELLNSLLFNSFDEFGNASLVAKGFFIHLGHNGDWKKFIRFADIIFLEAFETSTLIHLDKERNYFENNKKEIKFTRNIGTIVPQLIKVSQLFLPIYGTGKKCHYCINLMKLNEFRKVPTTGKSYLKLTGYDKELELNLIETLYFSNSGLVLNRQSKG